MTHSLKTLIQRALLIAAPSLLGCSGDEHGTITVPSNEGPSLSTDANACARLCVTGPLGGCRAPHFRGCDEIGPTTDGGILLDCNYGPPRDNSGGLCTGRRPAGLACATARGSALGAHFAEVAHLEAASVVAFERLASELRSHGAPAALVARSQRAARDEVRHARAMGQLARRFGAPVPPVRVAAPAARSLADLALENAVEGCVHESFGAAVGAWQARAASDGRIARQMAAVAVDEAAHAELAWDLDAWLQTRLGRAERRRVTAARRDAAAALPHKNPAPALQSLAGLPDAAVSRRLHGALSASLWNS
jgi:hypothetical protein